MTRRFIAAIAAVAIVLGACGGGTTTTTQTERVRIETTATEFKYTPNTWEIPAGKLVKVILHNRGTVEHNFAIPALKIDFTSMPAKDVEKDFAPMPAGTYDVECTVAGHKEAGMVGKLIVR